MVFACPALQSVRGKCATSCGTSRSTLCADGACTKYLVHVEGWTLLALHMLFMYCF